MILGIQPLYLVVVGGIFAFLTLMFQTLVGLRKITFKGALHAKVHRYIAYALIALTFLHGSFALATVVFGWF